MIYKKYLIKENDQFKPDDFPMLSEDLGMINLAMASVPSAFNTEMLISFLREHSIQSEQAFANPKLAEMIRSTSLPIANLEALFDSSNHNPLFQQQLAEYIRIKTKEDLNLIPSH